MARLKKSESKMNAAYDYLNENVKLKEEEFFAKKAEEERQEEQRRAAFLTKVMGSQKKSRDDLNNVTKETIVK